MFAALAAIASDPARATDSDEGLWTVVSTNGAFHHGAEASRWRYTFDAQARYVDIGSGINQYLVRPGVGFQVNDEWSAWVGYARLRSRNRAGNVSDENRYWQQLNWVARRTDSGTLSLRTRLEQRSLNTANDVRVVLRVRLHYVRPIGDNPGRYLAFGIEPFMDLNKTDWGGNTGLAQNRTTVATGWRVSDRLSIEAGYMNQFSPAETGEDRMNHLAVLHFKVGL
jgi:hypothetical protein